MNPEMKVLMASFHVPDRDTELGGGGGSAAGTLTPSSHRSSLVSGQLLYHPANTEVLEEPVEEQVSGPRCLGLHSFTLVQKVCRYPIILLWVLPSCTGSKGVLGSAVLRCI